jgi:hypothetical protein
MTRNKEARPGVMIPNGPSAKANRRGPDPTPFQVYRRRRRAGFPDAPLRRFTGWPEGLLAFLGAAA